jgi:hypothetical protein
VTRTGSAIAGRRDRRRSLDELDRWEIRGLAGEQPGLFQTVLLDAIGTQAKLINVTDLEARLDELEKQAGMVDFRARRN